ncbi:MAG: glycosyl hydrolase [Cyclobacteriaceae bacterium]
MKGTFTTKILIVAMLSLFLLDTNAQRRRSNSTAPSKSFDESLYNAIQWRSIGPFRGGRASGAAGVPGKPNVFYMAATGGGVWKTTDGGQSWFNISDGYFGGSIGEIAVAESNPNVLYVGTGEKTLRGNVSPGYGGMFKSYDGGKTWESIGLPNSYQIGNIVIHPKDPDVVFVAVIGNLFADSPDRGVYKTTDGGKSWNKVLYANPSTGAADITFEPGNPRILYATTWNVRRTPYSLSSGGEGSALWKSTDMGETWKNISGNEGLPEGIWGITGVSVSPVNPDRVYALIENEEGGLFRSDDAGKTWQFMTGDRNLRQRAWYYTRVFADTQQEDRVYIMNVQFWRSDDGGRNFKSFNTPHGDHHDLWIAPEDNNRLVVADDGGAQVSYDAGENWSTYLNQPTAQYYRVTVDNDFPYRILVAQQDNSTQRVRHRSDDRGITERDWDESAGGESAHLAVDPDDNNIVYGGSYGGLLQRMDHSTNQTRTINVWPDNPMGHGVEDMKYRFQWNFPIFFSPHNNDKLYTTSQHLHVSYNEGQTWEIISPDLTRAEPEKMGTSGGPITKDNTAVEYYSTIFAAVESSDEEGLIWAGSDDGLLHVTQDGGKNWTNVTPPDAPKYLMYNSVDVDPFTKGGLYVAGTLYKAGDFKPYLYKTKDYGQTWTKIVGGIPNNHFTRVLRADPKRQGLLYAGTEAGMYISFDDGASWKPMQLNLPQVPITDAVLKNDNLIVATQGRSIWLIDDLTPFHQLSDAIASSQIHLFKPIDSYRMGSGGGFGSIPSNWGENHHNGVRFFFNLQNELSEEDKLSFEIMESDGTSIKTFSNMADDDKEKLKADKGSNGFTWDMRYGDAEGFDNLIMWAAGLTGPKAVPGNYKAKLTLNDQSVETGFTILKDPRAAASQADLQAQFDYLIEVRNKLSDAHNSIKDIRLVREQMISLQEKLDGKDEFTDIVDKSKDIDSKMTDVEEQLYQTKNQSRQDPLNFPIRLNNKLAHLSRVVGNGDYPPTDQAVEVKNEMTQKIDTELGKWQKILAEDIQELNQMVKEKAVDAIIIEKKDPAIP